MKKYNGYKEEAIAPAEKLPVGSYVLKILAVKLVEGEAGKSDRLELAIDVAEGEHKDFYKKQFDANTSEDKKFKGKAIMWCPMDDGSDQDKKAIRTFNSFAAYLADANPGYHWNWEENTLKGKIIGGTFRQEYNIIESKEVSYTAFAWFCSAEDVRSGKAKPANPKYRNGATGKPQTSGDSVKTDSDGFLSVPDGVEEELPF